jgi:hypothetical protein
LRARILGVMVDAGSGNPNLRTVCTLPQKIVTIYRIMSAFTARS